MRDDLFATSPDWRSLDLAPGGRSLIEASAGTGKTWTIAALYLRLMLEGEVPLTPRQVIVTTFTDAAAQELRERLRARLRWAESLAAAARDEASVDVDDNAVDAAWLQARWHDAPRQAHTDLLRLRLALAELDLAPIATLHGLCRRILAEFPFASGSAFGRVELVAADDLLEELIEDLWRRLQQADDPDARHVGSLAELRQIAQLLLTPGVGLWTPEASDIERELGAAMQAELDALLREDGLFARSNAKLKTALQGLLAFARDPAAGLSAKHVENLLDRDIDKQFKPQRLAEMREHPLLQRAADAVRLAEYAAAGERVAAWRRWREVLLHWREERLSARGQLSFDSLIARVAEAIAAPDGLLADALFAAWPVALIDEFQDTDAQQYAILDRLYRDGAGDKRGRLVMIGDPKQAIYRFRGGDIHAYLAAAGSADEVLRLDTNFRSSREYVAALNEWYALSGTALSMRTDGGIDYHAMRASARRDAMPYADAQGRVHARPLHWHYAADIPAAAGQRRERALRACANHIAGLLNAGERIGDRPLRPGDIAVLLPGNADIVQLRALLQARGVPCVGAGRSSVFESEWARDLQIALYAAAHPGDEGAVRAALATRFGGWRFVDFLGRDEGSSLWTQALQRYADLRERWRREGVLSVVLDLAGAAALRLPDLPARERALTDLRHLGELLQAQETRVDGPTQLLAWLSAQRRGDGDDAGEAADERQLRLESDAARVRLMTLHASKGLEFPIVFLPLMWRHDGRRHERHIVLDEPLCGQRVLGIGSGPRADHAQEGQDERFRVLYVALTRAQYACHVYVLPPDRPTDSRSTKPLGDPERSAVDATLARLQAALPPGQSAGDLGAHIGWSVDEWSWPDTPYVDTTAAATRPLSVRQEPPRARPEATYSFTALIAQHDRDDAAADEGEAPQGQDIVDIDLDSEPIATPHPRLLALAELRGPEFGNALHAIFEHRAPTVPMAAQRELIAAWLQEFGVRPDETERAATQAAIAALLQANLDVELLPGCRLGSLPATAQRAEMAFHFVLDDIAPNYLREVCARHGAADLLPPQLPTSSLRGLMTGKIDLVFAHGGRFHVLDYKSNFLGHTLEDYRGERLDAAMDAHAYRFQALLYSVAVQRYLRQRVAHYRHEDHFGEAIYLFVRAVGLAPGAGIWRHRFSAALLDDVDAVFAGQLVAEPA